MRRRACAYCPKSSKSKGRGGLAPKPKNRSWPVSTIALVVVFRRRRVGRRSRSDPLSGGSVEVVYTGDRLRHGAFTPRHARRVPLRQVASVDRRAQLQLHGTAARVRDCAQTEPPARLTQTAAPRRRGIHRPLSTERPHSRIRPLGYYVRLTSYAPM